MAAVEHERIAGGDNVRPQFAVQVDVIIHRLKHCLDGALGEAVHIGSREKVGRIVGHHELGKIGIAVVPCGLYELYLAVIGVLEHLKSGRCDIALARVDVIMCQPLDGGI